MSRSLTDAFHGIENGSDADKTRDDGNPARTDHKKMDQDKNKPAAAAVETVAAWKGDNRSLPGSPPLAEGQSHARSSGNMPPSLLVMPR